MGLYAYDESISRAIRHVLNDQGACQTYGDAYGNSVEDVLRKYYSYGFTGLELIKITSPNLLNQADFFDSPRHAMEYILSQECIEKDWILSTEKSLMGVGCACAQPTDSGTKQWTCYIGLADTNSPREINERLPQYQDFDETGVRSCTSYCPYFSTNNLDKFTENFWSYTCPQGQVMDASGICHECDELAVGCSVCSDANVVAGQTYDNCRECSARIELEKSTVTPIEIGQENSFRDRVHSYPPMTGYEWWQDTCSHVDCKTLDPATGKCTECHWYDYDWVKDNRQSGCFTAPCGGGPERNRR